MSNSYFNHVLNIVSDGVTAFAAAVNNVATEIQAAFAKLPSETEFKLGTERYVTDTGADDAFVVTLTRTPTLTVGLEFTMLAQNANPSGACTVNPNSLGATSIKYPDGTNPAANAIVSGQIVQLRYDGTNFQLISNTPAQITAAAASAVAAAASETAAATSETNAAASEAAAAASAAEINVTTGSWTPELWDGSEDGDEGQTYTVQVGTYTKMGDIVFLEGHISMSSIGTLAGTQLYIGNLPYNSSNEATFGMGQCTGLNITAGENLTGRIVTGTPSKISLQLWDLTTGSGAAGVTEIPTGANIYFSGFYTAV